MSYSTAAQEIQDSDFQSGNYEFPTKYPSSYLVINAARVSSLPLKYRVRVNNVSICKHRCPVMVNVNYHLSIMVKTKKLWLQFMKLVKKCITLIICKNPIK